MSSVIDRWPPKRSRLARRRRGPELRAVRFVGHNFTDNLPEARVLDTGNLIQDRFGREVLRCLQRLREPPPEDTKVVAIYSRKFARRNGR